MAKIKPQKADEKLVISEFGGVRQTSALTGKNAWKMRNFRITSDGALEKRTGTRTLFEFEDEIRGVWQGSLNGGEYLIAIAGANVYVRTQGQSELELVQQLTTAEGSVSLVLYSNDLFLFDGAEIYHFDTATNQFITSIGFVPLYGDNWDPLEKGPVNQPLNALCAKFILRYDNTTTRSGFFRLPFTCSSIVAMEVDGTPITNYSFTPNGTSFTIPAQYANGILTVALTLPDSYSRYANIATMRKAFPFSDAHRNSLLLYGGVQSNQMAYSTAVTDTQWALCTHFFPANSDHLYLPGDNFFSLADTTHPIHAVFRDRNRVIALNDRSAWALEFSSDRLVSYPLESGIGCSTPGGMTLCGEDPIVIQNGGIFRLRFPSGESDICVAESLSREVIEILPASLFQNGILAWFPSRDELWLRDPTEEEEGLVWVYNQKRKEWYCFSGLPITSFFELEGTIGFSTNDNTVLLPDETSYSDSGRSVSAYYCSQFLVFSTPENTKRALRLTVCADTGGQTMTVGFDTETQTRNYTAVSQTEGKPDFFDFTLCGGRFRLMRYLFSISGTSPARIYRFSAFANA